MYSLTVERKKQRKKAGSYLFKKTHKFLDIFHTNAIGRVAGGYSKQRSLIYKIKQILAGGGLTTGSTC